jgi:uncharacterized protein
MGTAPTIIMGTAMTTEADSAPPAGGLTDVCLLVADVTRSVAFYRDRMGFSLKRLDTGFAEFWTRGVILALWQRDDIGTNLAQPDLLRGGASCMVAVRFETIGEVDAEYARLKDAGVTFLEPPHAYAWNAHCAYFRDPDGHLWELYYWLGAPRVIEGTP